VKWELGAEDFDHDWNKTPVIAKLVEGKAPVHQSHQDRVRVHVDGGRHRFG